MARRSSESVAVTRLSAPCGFGPAQLGGLAVPGMRIPVLSADVADRAGLHAHDHRAGLGHVAGEAYAVEHVAVRHAGRSEGDGISGREIGLAIDAPEVADPHLSRAGPLLVAPEHEPPLDRAAEASQRGRGEHAFRRAARAHQDIDTG